MGSKSATVLLVGTLSVSALHALIPSHWLSFALVARAERWRLGRTLRVVALAATGHLILTLVLGLALATVGKALIHAIPERVENIVAALVLIGLGGYFGLPALRGRRGCAHAHDHDYPVDAEHISEPGSRRPGRSGAPSVMGALVMGLTLSPCLDLVAVFVPAAGLPWHVVLGMCAIMVVTTLAIMLGLVAVSVSTLERLNIGWLEQNEGAVMGAMLACLGVLVLMLKT